MKIMILGSMTFAEEMLAAEQQLQELGFEGISPFDAKEHAQDTTLIDDFERNLRYCIEENVMRKGFQQVADADAVLVLNHEKNGVPGYIGTSALMEMGIAHWLGKRIFLLHEPPAPEQCRWAHEVQIMQPTILHGVLHNLSSSL
jgi:nucleoside 2-deoxyribosyltransferase